MPDTPVEVHFVGSGDAFGSGGRFQTCIAVRFAGGRLLIDCGASSLIALKREGIDPHGVGHILITHLHGDHFGGLPFFLLHAQHVLKRTAPLEIIGPPGLEARVMTAMEIFFPGSTEVAPRFDIRFCELAPRKMLKTGRFGVAGFPVAHASGAPAYALRVETAGRIIAYSGDTEWTEELVAASRGADLFICESYFYDKRMKYHLDYSRLAAHLSALACRRIVITHMSEDMLAHLDDLTLEAATDGMRVVL